MATVHALRTFDEWASQFKRLHADSLSAVEAVTRCSTQMRNVAGLHVSQAPTGASFQDRTVARLYEMSEEALARIRDDLGAMDEVVQRINATLHENAAFFAAGEGPAGISLMEVLERLSSLYASYQGELLRLREVFADYTCEDIGDEEFLGEWSTMKEVSQVEEAELDAILDVFSQFSV